MTQNNKNKTLAIFRASELRSHLGGIPLIVDIRISDALIGDMALKLSQVLDLAISADIASVNFLHLRDVLVTVVASLDIGSVTVKRTTHAVDCAADGDVEGSDHLPLSDIEEQENGSVTHNGECELENLNMLQFLSFVAFRSLFVYTIGPTLLKVQYTYYIIQYTYRLFISDN